MPLYSCSLSPRYLYQRRPSELPAIRCCNSIRPISSLAIPLSRHRILAAWQRQPLPDNWLVSHPGASGYGWYRLHFVLSAEPDEMYAAYMPLLETFGALYVNGGFGGQTGAFERISRTAQLSRPFVAGAPPVMLGYAPRLFSIRHDVLHAGTNTVHLRLWVKGGTRGALSGITIGPEPLVRAVYEQRVLVTVVGRGWSSSFRLVSGCLFCCFGFGCRPSDSLCTATPD